MRSVPTLQDVTRILTAVAIARDGLTADERTLLAAICAGFGLSLAEVLPVERQAITAEPSAVMQLPALAEQPAAEEKESGRCFIFRP